MHRYLDKDSIEGMRLACGRKGIEKFYNLLRLDKIGYKIIAMGWIGSRIVLEIANCKNGKEEESLILYITKRIETQPSLIKTKYLDIYYNSNKADEKFVEHLLSIDFSDITFENLIDILLEDPELGDPSLRLPEFEKIERPENHLDSWGGRDLYANFFAEGEFARAQLDSVNIYQNCVFIQHSDIECVSLKPNLDLRLIRFLVKYPWLSRNKKKYEGLKRDELPDINKFFSTDLKENDIIMGHNKLSDIFDFVLSNIKGKDIFISNTCTPVVIGEDVDSIVERVRKKRDILYLTVTPQSMEVVLKALFKKSVPRNRKRTKTKGLINLLGYERDYYLSGLIALLKKLGIMINSVAIPDVSPSTLKKYYLGGIDVIKPNSIWEHLYSQLSSMSGHKFVAIEAPYGFEGSIRWIEEVSKLNNICISREEILKNINPVTIEEYNLLKDRIKNIGLIFIIRKGEEMYLTDSAKSWGVPLLKFFMEIGSRIEVFIRAENMDEARANAEKILQILKGYPDYEVRYFESFDSMMTLLKRSNCRLVFSNHSNDWRITSSGKNVLSLNDFEIGFEGAIYTLNRVIFLADVEFFRKYTNYLNRDYTGRYV